MPILMGAVRKIGVWDTESDASEPSVTGRSQGGLWEEHSGQRVEQVQRPWATGDWNFHRTERSATAPGTRDSGGRYGQI